MVVETLSPVSVKVDWWKKFQLYERAGVKEYWIVDAGNESVEVFLLEKENYRLNGIFTKGDIVAVKTVPGLEIDVSLNFDGVQDKMRIIIVSNTFYSLQINKGRSASVTAGCFFCAANLPTTRCPKLF